MVWIWLLVLAAGVAAEEEGGKCERIRLPLCQDLGYNWTAMPNLLGHKDQKEAEEAMSSLAELISSECSPHVRFVVCSAFAPLCSEEVAGAVSACRAVCEQAAAACGRPPALDCAAFPLRPDRRLCMRPPNASEPRPEPAPAPWPAPPHPSTDAPPRPAWLAALAWLSLLSCSFALVTFCAEPARYRYPSRPVVWMAACHAAVALGHAARGWAGAAAEVPLLAFTSYFTLAADAWFAAAGVAWYLTAAAEWSTEALERAAAYLHAGAWGWAGAWAAAGLALRGGAGGEAAAVGRGAALLAGAALGAAAAPGVRRVRAALPAGGARRVGRLAARAAAAAALYGALAAASAAAQALRAPAALGAALCLVSGVASAAWAWSRKSALVWRRALCPPRKAPGAAPPLLAAQPPYYKRPLHVSRV